MGYTILDRRHMTRDLAIAIATVAITLVRSHGDSIPPISAPEIVSPEIDIVDPVHVVAHDERAPDRCLPIDEIRVLRGHVTYGDIDPDDAIRISNAIVHLDPRRPFAVRVPPGALANLVRGAATYSEHGIQYQANVIHQTAGVWLLCEGDAWITLARRHYMRCGNDRRPEWEWGADVVIDSLD